MLIGEVARRSGVSPRMLRHYDALGGRQTGTHRAVPRYYTSPRSAGSSTWRACAPSGCRNEQIGARWSIRFYRPPRWRPSSGNGDRLNGKRDAAGPPRTRRLADCRDVRTRLLIRSLDRRAAARDSNVWARRRRPLRSCGRGRPVRVRPRRRGCRAGRQPIGRGRLGDTGAAPSHASTRRAVLAMRAARTPRLEGPGRCSDADPTCRHARCAGDWLRRVPAMVGRCGGVNSRRGGGVGALPTEEGRGRSGAGRANCARGPPPDAAWQQARRAVGTPGVARLAARRPVRRCLTRLRRGGQRSRGGVIHRP
ncbi:MerR family DNA-binding transcriptional regulator [Streptomyces sp. DHE17-7]|uniref:MerR family DNA-binding transcriptional regulator n=1 Tax=Streptomyces sp. DHE17-7 TaxID=2759949 RepID=UPI003FA7054B